jgi:hypothetical protein
MACTKCDRLDEHYHMEDLAPEECYALAFAQACAAGKNTPAMTRFMAGEVRLSKDMSEGQRKKNRQKGLKLLADRGIVKLKRAAFAGEYEVVEYDGSRLVGGGVVTGDFS